MTFNMTFTFVGRPSFFKVLQARIDNENLYWNCGEVDVFERREGDESEFYFRPSKKVIVASVLDEFISLDKAADREILAFARKFGGLRLCKRHNLPWGHLQLPSGTGACEAETTGKTGLFVEPLKLWRSYCHSFSGLRALALTSQNQTDAKASWSAVIGEGRPLGLRVNGAPWKLERSKQLEILGALVSSLLQLWGFTPRITFDGAKFVIEPGPWEAGVLVHLVIELAQMMIVGQAKAICDNCGRTISGRRRDSDRHRYCKAPVCLKARAAQNQRDRRAGIAPLWKNPTRTKLNRQRTRK